MSHKNKEIVIFSIIFVLISVTIGSYSFILYQSIKQSLVSEIGASARATAATIAAFLEDNIVGYKSLVEEGKPMITSTNMKYYDTMLIRFQDIKAMTGADFVYTLDYVSDNKVAYVLDGEKPGSMNFSAIGTEDIMEKHTQAAFASGDSLASDIVKEEKWGYYVTGSAPIKDSSGTIIGLACVDYSLDYVQNTIKKCFVTLITLSILLSILFSLTIYKLVREKFSAKSIDYLTSLYSRSYLDKVLLKLIKKCNLKNGKLSLLMLDVDHFKAINDQHGHFFGDKVLIDVAGVIRKCTRSQDICVRQGGDEFIVVLPGAEEFQTAKIANRILTKIRELQLANDGIAVKLTLSIGTAEWQESMTPIELIARADKMLYRSKNTGKDKCST